MFRFFDEVLEFIGTFFIILFFTVLGILFSGVFTFGFLIVFALMGVDPPTRGATVVALFPGCGLGFSLSYYLWTKATQDKEVGDSHGAARFADATEESALKLSGDLLIGQSIDDDALFRYDGKSHLMTLAPTRSGKGVGTVIPNLLHARRSVIVIDPKGENTRITARARKAMGSLYVLDPFGITGHPSSAFNPLSQLEPNSIDLGEDASALAEALVVDPPNQVQDAHWNEEAKALITGLILHCVTHEPEDRRTLSTIREYLTLPFEDFAKLLVQMQDSPHADGLVARAANRHVSKAAREAGSVLSNAQRHTHFLDSPRIAKVTSKTDFKFADLRKGIASVFIVLPPDRLDVYARWLRLIISQGLQDIVRAAQTPQEAPRAAKATNETDRTAQLLSRPSQRSVLFMLDEFASLGRLAPVERAMGLMAGYGVQLWPILQDLSQLKEIYGERANTFIANSGVLQVFGVNDYETAKWLSLTIGQETRLFETDSKSLGTTNSTSEGLTARDLLAPDEIMQLENSKQILRVQGMPPILAVKISYWNDPRFKGQFDEDQMAVR